METKTPGHVADNCSGICAAIASTGTSGGAGDGDGDGDRLSLALALANRPRRKEHSKVCFLNLRFASLTLYLSNHTKNLIEYLGHRKKKTQQGLFFLL